MLVRGASTESVDLTARFPRQVSETSIRSYVSPSKRRIWLWFRLSSFLTYGVSTNFFQCFLCICLFPCQRKSILLRSTRKGICS